MQRNEFILSIICCVLCFLCCILSLVTVGIGAAAAVLPSIIVTMAVSASLWAMAGTAWLIRIIYNHYFH